METQTITRTINMIVIKEQNQLLTGPEIEDYLENVRLSIKVLQKELAEYEERFEILITFPVDILVGGKLAINYKSERITIAGNKFITTSSSIEEFISRIDPKDLDRIESINIKRI